MAKAWLLESDGLTVSTDCCAIIVPIWLTMPVSMPPTVADVIGFEVLVKIAMAPCCPVKMHWLKLLGKTIAP